MDFAVRQPRHAMVHAPGKFTDFRMQRAAERDVHLLEAAADAEQRHAAGDTGSRQRQCHASRSGRRARGAGPPSRRTGSDGHWRAPRSSRMPSTTSSNASASVISGVPANISGSAPATSATARRLRSPTRCAVKRPSTRSAPPITPTTGRFVVTAPAQFRSCGRYTRAGGQESLCRRDAALRGLPNPGLNASQRAGAETAPRTRPLPGRAGGCRRRQSSRSGCPTACRAVLPAPARKS